MPEEKKPDEKRGNKALAGSANRQKGGAKQTGEELQSEQRRQTAQAAAPNWRETQKAGQPATPSPAKVDKASAADKLKEMAAQKEKETADKTASAKAAQDNQERLKNVAAQHAAQRERLEKEAAAKAPQFVAEHKVAGGETLGAIASKYYGSSTRDKWMAIYEANKEVIGDNPSLIRAGQLLKIPKLND